MYFQVPVTAKRHYLLYDMDALTKAYISVQDDSMPITKAARLNGVPEQPCAKEFLKQLMLTVRNQVQIPCSHLNKKLG